MPGLKDAVEDIAEESGEDREAIESELGDFFGVPVSIQRIQIINDANPRIRIDVQPEDVSDKLQETFPDLDVRAVAGSFSVQFNVDLDS
jgi:hypothetical protein